MNPIVTQLIFEDCEIAYAITDRELVVVEVNGTEDVFDQASVGRSLLDCVPEMVGSEAVLSEILDGFLPRFELAWVNRETPQGRTLYLNMVDLPYRDERGQIVGLLHVVRDVTEAGTLEQRLTQHRNELRLLRDQLARQNLELEAANVELRRLDEMKSIFVSVAAHELRTPLTSVSGFVEVLLDEDLGPLNETQREYLEMAQAGAERLLHITDSLLDVTCIEAGRIELVLQPRDLASLVQAVAAEYAPQVTARAQRLTLHAPPDLPAILCDKTRTVQIVGNLLSNAIKYTPEGGSITNSLALAEEAGFVRVAVADTGVGISSEDQPKLFRRFFRAASAVQTRAYGAGLGLFITRSLVELHGGRIWFESEPDHGSTFYVTFPISDSLA